MTKRNFFGRKGWHRAQRTEKDWLYYDFVENVPVEFCPVCHLLEEREERQIEFLFYESVNDPGVRHKLREAGGLCKWHTERFLQQGDALGLSILARDLLEQNPDFSHHTSGDCPLCQTFAENEQRVALAVAGYLQFEEFWEALEKSPGVCQRHFEAIAGFITDKSLAKRWRDFQKQKIAVLKSALDEIVRKNDYRFQSEKITGAEARAIRLAWTFLRK